MRTLIHGTDMGNAMLAALVIIIVLSTLFVSIAPMIDAQKRYAEKVKYRAISEIEQSNREVLLRYDTH